jgi:leucine dehydrogenase
MSTLEIQNLPEYDAHSIVHTCTDTKNMLSGFISIHRGNENRPSFGATRIWHYENPKEALRDAMNLSRAMSYKAAMAGLNYGGAKGVLIAPKSLKSGQKKLRMLKAYADKINILKGGFITGTDVGISRDELLSMSLVTPYLVGIKVDPTEYTAEGIHCSMKELLLHRYGDESFSGKKIAIQGIGKIGSALVALLYGRAKKIIVCDIDQERVRKIRSMYPEVDVASPETIHSLDVDIFSPCSLAHAINKDNFREIKAQLIVGAANNQLANDETGDMLYKRGIFYAPDYVVNAGGLISVVSEYEKKGVSKKYINNEIKKIRKRLRSIINQSKTEDIAPHRIAHTIAEKSIKNT